MVWGISQGAQSLRSITIRKVVILIGKVVLAQHMDHVRLFATHPEPPYVLVLVVHLLWAPQFSMLADAPVVSVAEGLDVAEGLGVVENLGAVEG